MITISIQIEEFKDGSVGLLTKPKLSKPTDTEHQVYLIIKTTLQVARHALSQLSTEQESLVAQDSPGTSALIKGMKKRRNQ